MAEMLSGDGHIGVCAGRCELRQLTRSRSEHLPARVWELAAVLWGYLDVSDPHPPSVDFILAAGSNDGRVARKAAELYLAGRAPVLVVSGAFGAISKATTGMPEAVRFLQIALCCGVDVRDVIIEAESTNTAENIDFSRRAVLARGLRPRSCVLVTKPYLTRRALSVARRRWPEVRWHATSPAMTVEEGAAAGISEDELVALLVGNLDRISVYSQRGYQEAEEIPADVVGAFEELRSLGFTRFLVSGCT